MKFNLWQNMKMNKSLYCCLLVFLVSCSSDSDSNINKGPSFGYHVDRINRVNEGEVNIGIFQAIDAEGDAINYTISNTDMSIDENALVTFNAAPDFETVNEYSAVITASNDAGSDEINLTVYINDSDCEFDTAAILNGCLFK
jgi:hypothetical protein